MANTVSQDMLTALADVYMPCLGAEPEIAGAVTLRGHRVPVHACRAVIMGSGAAGLRASVKVRRRGGDVVVVSQSA